MVWRGLLYGVPAEFQDAPTKQLQTSVDFEQGQGIFVRLKYSEGVKNWEAALFFASMVVLLVVRKMRSVEPLVQTQQKKSSGENR